MRNAYGMDDEEVKATKKKRMGGSIDSSFEGTSNTLANTKPKPKPTMASGQGTATPPISSVPPSMRSKPRRRRRFSTA